ncbi:hypothetical protein [Desulfosarcina variabilis]|uniref:hypothetical protein n=1 Tax=Desulfosarcina variabilis TaxID=2300 RepID=UPI003AFAD9F3
MAGQAKRRGTFEQRKAQAIAAGRTKKSDRRNTPPPQVEDMLRPVMVCPEMSPHYMQALQQILDLSRKGNGMEVILLGDHRGLVERFH